MDKVLTELLFSPVGTLKPKVERLADRAKGRYVAVDITDRPNLAPIAHQAAAQSIRAAELLQAALVYDVQPLRVRALPYSSQISHEL